MRRLEYERLLLATYLFVVLLTRVVLELDLGHLGYDHFLLL